MSDIIHLLPDSVANQIAAGEVIQRPASIIKELVENSLDAGATHIQVVVEDAGKTLVQVIDNGCGMSATDARMSFERHATSKIEQATDLFALQTMGFRGEALASIAAVAQVELRTRTKEAELGTCLTIDGSKVMGQEPVSCPVGANFAVRNLFFNIPARRKFLKSNQTELSNILAEFERIALAHPDKAFTLHSGGSVMMDLPAGNLRRRIVGIFGTRIDKNLVPVDVETTLAHINGFVGMPAAARKKNAHQYLFVNGRFMRHPYFAKAILTAYDRLIPEGQQVPFFLSFKVDPARIDVNIHPTKTEIKFEDDNAIFQILMAAVRESLGKYGAVPAIDFNNDDRFDLPIFNSQPSESQEVAPPQVHINPNFNPFEQSDKDSTTDDISPKKEAPTSDETFSSQAFTSTIRSSINEPFSNSSSAGSQKKTTPADGPSTFASRAFGGSENQHRSSAIDWENVYNSTLNAASAPSTNANPSQQPTDTATSFVSTEEQTAGTFSSSALGGNNQTGPSTDKENTFLFGHLPEEEQKMWTQQSGTCLHYLGRYIVTSLNDGLALIDQHRAHIRVLYDRYRKLFSEHHAPSQRMLFPEMVNLSPSESVMLDHIMPQLTDIGFDISPLGNGAYSIMAMPSGTEGLSATTLVGSILEDAINGQADAEDTINHIISLSLARKVAMPIGQALSNKEMTHLLDQLFACQTPNLTPDGLPTLVILPNDRIGSWF